MYRIGMRILRAALVPDDGLEREGLPTEKKIGYL